MTDIKNEDWTSAQQQLQELVDRKGTLSKDAQQRLVGVLAAEKAEESFRRALQEGAYRDASGQLEGMHWPKTKERLLNDLRSVQRKRAQDIKSRADAMNANSDLDGILQIQEEFERFVGQMEDPSLGPWAKEVKTWLAGVEERLKANRGDKAVFDAAVADFNGAKDKGDLKRMQGDVLQKFQKIARGSGAFRSEAQVYLDKTIPDAMQEMMKTMGKGRILVPPINCVGQGEVAGKAAAAADSDEKQTISCGQLDAGVFIQWIGSPTVELPSSANQPGKLPYPLRLKVFIEPSGKVRVEKDGNADKDFFKKAKDAAKGWKATIPKAGGKPVTVSFPLTITFQ